MPTYTYECQKCHQTTDLFHAMSETPRVKCPACGSVRMKRLLGTGAGVGGADGHHAERNVRCQFQGQLEVENGAEDQEDHQEHGHHDRSLY